MLRLYQVQIEGTGKMLVTKGATTSNKTIWSQTVLVDNKQIVYFLNFMFKNAVAASPAQFRVLINGLQITISPLSATNAGSPVGQEFQEHGTRG